MRAPDDSARLRRMSTGVGGRDDAIMRLVNGVALLAERRDLNCPSLSKPLIVRSTEKREEMRRWVAAKPSAAIL